MTVAFQRDSGSFRDPSGYVFSDGQRILRSVSPRAAEQFRATRSSGLIDEAVSRGLLIATHEVDDPSGLAGLTGARGEHPSLVLEHPRIPVISYPYEWTFSQLKDAALRHLDLQTLALSRGFELSDATAYNMQFDLGLPTHIDVLSLREYREGRPWEGYNQFCRQFLFPLLVESVMGMPFQRAYRGSMTGLDVLDMAKMLSPWKKFTSLNLLLHVHLQASAVKGASSSNLGAEPIRIPQISKTKYLAMADGLRDWIAGLESGRHKKTFWAEYAAINSYSDQEKLDKQAFVRRTVEDWGCETVADVGGNSGDYTEAAMSGGARRGYVLDADIDALELAYGKRKKGNEGLLPLVVDWSDPPPGQGWGGVERKPLRDRLQVDCMMALAVIHHIVISGNVPLRSFLEQIFAHGKRAIIEFVPKSDPMVVGLLRAREDIFDEYTEEHFVALLGQFASVESVHRFREGGRAIFACTRL